MTDNSKQVLLWGIKILAERYWAQPFNQEIDGGLITNVCDLMPGSNSLIGRLDQGYAESAESDLYALQSIFTRIQLKGGRKLSNLQYLHPVADFEVLNLPVENPIIDKSFFKDNAVDFSQFSTESAAQLLLNVVQKYGGFLPAKNEPNCSMPLYEYIKIAAALAVEPDGDFRLVLGDLSGIQDFIYTIASEKALKVLRARSFYLELMIETLAQEICADLSLTSANIFFAGGGNFLLLLPESADLDAKLQSYYQAVNTFFLDQFEGNLHMPFATIKLTHAELKQKSGDIIRERWNKLFEVELSTAKNQKFRSLLTGLDRPKEVDAKSCKICHADTRGINLTDGSCDVCRKLEEIGTNLHGWKSIPGYSFADSGFEIPQIKDGLWPFSCKGAALRKLSINEIDLNANPMMFYCNHIPLKEDDRGRRIPATFEDMANDAIGAKRIATLAMDVDNMSKVFRQGLDVAEFLLNAPTLSRMLDYFFKPGLRYICERPGFQAIERPATARNLAVIYSGGDDLLLAGGWNDVAEIAIDIQRNFSKFTCHNSQMGISGAMYVSSDSFPFYISVSKAKYAENNYAKKQDGKNSMVFYYDEFTNFLAEQLPEDYKKRYLLSAAWQEVEEEIIHDLGQFLAPELAKIENDKVSVAYSHGFVGKISEMHKKYLQSPEGEIYIPDWVYQYARLEKHIRPKLNEIYKRFHRYDEKKTNNPIRYLPVVLNWVELLLRDKGE